MKGKKKGAGAVCAAVALTLLGSGCEKIAGASAEPTFEVKRDAITVSRAGPIAFDVSTAKVGPALPLPPVTARITTVEALTSPSFAPLSGRVVEAKVRLGDQVHKGQQLVLVRTADLPNIERDVRSAELSVATREATVSRMRALVQSRAGAQHDLVLAESELAEARLALSAARARLKSLQIARGKDATAYWVLATRSGTVVQLDATPGSQVGPERSAPVAVVADLSEVLAVADVAPADAVQLEVGASARIFPLGAAGRSVSGVIEVISAVVDPERQTVPVRVQIDNRERLMRPNAYVDLAFSAAGARTAVLLPALAVVRDGANAVVFVQSESGSYVRRPVVLGRRSRDEVEVLSGVEPGERVVVHNALLLLNAIDIEA